MHDYATQRARLRRRGPASLCTDGDLKEANRQLTRAMRARPSLHVCAAIARRAGTTATRQGVLGDRATMRPLVTCSARSTTSCSTGRLSASSSTRCRSSAGSLTSSTQVGATGGSPLTPAELRLLPYLQTHLTIREIGERLFVSRNTVSSEVGSIYRKLGVSSRSDAVQHATAIGLLGG